MNVNIRVTGLKETVAKVRDISKGIQLTSREEVETALKLGYAFMKKAAPKDTGALIRAIRYTIKGAKGKEIGQLIVEQPNHPRTGRTKPYHTIMFLNPGLKNWGNDPNFIRNAVGLLETAFPKRISDRVGMLVK